MADAIHPSLARELGYVAPPTGPATAALRAARRDRWAHLTPAQRAEREAVEAEGCRIRDAATGGTFAWGVHLPVFEMRDLARDNAASLRASADALAAGPLRDPEAVMRRRGEAAAWARLAGRAERLWQEVRRG